METATVDRATWDVMAKAVREMAEADMDLAIQFMNERGIKSTSEKPLCGPIVFLLASFLRLKLWEESGMLSAVIPTAAVGDGELDAAIECFVEHVYDADADHAGLERPVIMRLMSARLVRSGYWLAGSDEHGAVVRRIYGTVAADDGVIGALAGFLFHTANDMNLGERNEYE